MENIIKRLARRYDEVVLRAIATLPPLTHEQADDLNILEDWSRRLSDTLPKGGGGRLANGDAGAYTAALDRGRKGGEGVRIGVTRIQHGLGTTRYIPREFFDTNEYHHIMAFAAKLDGLIDEGAFVRRGDKQEAIESFAAVIRWLMDEARRGQTIQRYKGLGEMNPGQLWDTTVNPDTRRLMQVKIEDGVKADEIFTTLMGDQVEPRREFIERNALTVSNLDV